MILVLSFPVKLLAVNMHRGEKIYQLRLLLLIYNFYYCNRRPVRRLSAGEGQRFAKRGQNQGSPLVGNLKSRFWV